MRRPTAAVRRVFFPASILRHAVGEIPAAAAAPPQPRFPARFDGPEPLQPTKKHPREKTIQHHRAQKPINPYSPR
jgi:hypothetical protein